MTSTPTQSTRPRDDTTAWRGVAAEDKNDLNQSATLFLRARSRRLLSQLLRPHRQVVRALLMIALIENVSRLAVPYLVHLGIDRGIPPIVNGGIGRTLLVVVTVIFAMALVQAYTRRVFLLRSGKLGQAILLDLRRRVFDHFQRLSPSFHEEYTSGRVISRLTSDVDAINEMLQTGFDGLVTALLTLIGTAVLLLSLDLKLGLIALISFPVLLAITAWFRHRSAIIYRRTREAVALVIVHFVESMTGIRAVQAFRREPRNEESSTVSTAATARPSWSRSG